MRECRYCGHLFQEENGHQVFCSDHCRNEQHNLYHRISRKKKIEARGYVPVRSHKDFNTIERIQARVNTKSSKILYLGGYTDDKGKIYLQCTDCGYMFASSTKVLRPSKGKTIQCDNCRHILSEIRQREHQEVVFNNMAVRKEQARLSQIQKESEKIKARHKRCRECDKEFYADNPRAMYCSDECRKKFNNRTHDLKRRIKIRENLIDKDISLIKLAKRDNDTCWICKRKVDWCNFETTKEGWYISGKNYPSIDHVIALANGGKHSWENVRLAHCKCNTEKRDKLIGENPSGQLVLFL